MEEKRSIMQGNNCEQLNDGELGNDLCKKQYSKIKQL